MRNFGPLLIVVTVAVFIEVALSSCAAKTAPGAQAGPGLRSAPAVVPGASATFAEAALVKVRNLEPLDAKTGYFEFDNECLALDGGVVTAVARHRDRVLVRYEPPKKKFYGVCPAGTLFFVQADDFASMNDRYRANLAGLESERRLVGSLLAGPQPSP